MHTEPGHQVNPGAPQHRCQPSLAGLGVGRVDDVYVVKAPEIVDAGLKGRRQGIQGPEVRRHLQMQLRRQDPAGLSDGAQQVGLFGLAEPLALAPIGAEGLQDHLLQVAPAALQLGQQLQGGAALGSGLTHA